MKDKKIVHVKPKGEKWQVKSSDAKRAVKITETRAEAVQIGREIAINQGIELWVHPVDETIYSTDSLGYQPFPPIFKFSGFIKDKVMQVKKNSKIGHGKGCHDCGCFRYQAMQYMVKNSVWSDANANKKCVLCLGCLSERVGRKLARDDFEPNVPINTALFSVLDFVE